ncbi:NADH-quinone oxidoreductase subunit NuoF [Clostridium sp. MB40-C1]|uniref:NADH-quinone oxidoreductase subunit NuoF n=1 Tax=Clostridium sp. MB40-C1 TaxID=3070996 RepID=UPI0027E20201|nr:NADH-quinone oxidoreductase subunit NuoF [Clostridium sp. MB40-C1]WMJ80423.1 NADH-quinone oxidoreductase subunit NuoF [Clostridium sp. MB40-C1]
MEFYALQVLICGGEGCNLADSKKISNLLKLELKQCGLDKEVEVIKTACLGFCNLGPVMIVYPEGIVYSNIKPSDIHEIVQEHFINGRVVKRLCYTLKLGDGRIKNLQSIDMFKKQERIVLRNCGIINPEKIDEYIARDGYKGLGEVLTKMSPEEVIDVISESGLRGRGGGGFPTGKKWSFAAAQKNEQKYIICNADEGDPGAFMDRSVLEGDPHTILEAMTIGGYAIGANKGFIYVRAEYPLAVERLKIAIRQAKEYGLLGNDILGTGFKFDIEIRLGAGAFVCGEETALIKSIEGKRGMPVTKPPFPAVSGLWGKPTVINNVETYANICPIILKGSKWFRSIGTEKSPGTKVFALGGKIRNTGLVEIPMGTTLRDVIFNIGGGIPNNKHFKAVQTGGPSGGCIPARYINIPIEYDTLIELGSMMGSGGMIVMDEDNCMVDVARFFLDFTKDESCGKCTPCRIGTKRLLEILEIITNGEGSLNDVEKLEKLGYEIKNTALCGLGQTAPNPILSTLRYFKDEYISHVVDKKCPAKACKSLVKYRINADVCKRCGMCAKNCPSGAIIGRKGEAYKIDKDKCIKCGSCMHDCLFNAIVKE